MVRGIPGGQNTDYVRRGGVDLRLTEYARSRGRPELISQWYVEKNGELSPDQITIGSDRAVWWRCESGHEWRSNIDLRTKRGQGCPYCAGQRVLPGETDLISRYPEVAARWHPTRNGTLTPKDIMPFTHKRCWWQCEKGHEWQVSPNALIHGSGCPYCAGKKAIPGETDLATRYPELADQWHPLKNGDLLATEVGQGCTKKVWWRCELGHDYEACVFSRVQGTGCPYCAGKKALSGFNDLATLYPNLMREWHPTLNGALTPQRITRGSHKQVWWQCSQGHVWRAVVFARTKKNGTGCPVCTGNVKKLKNAKLA